MNQTWQQPEPALARWLGYSAALHIFLLALLLLFPQRREETQLRIQMVRLAGGGENKPGWVKPAEAPAPTVNKKPAVKAPEGAKPVAKPPAQPAAPAAKEQAPARSDKPAAEAAKPEKEAVASPAPEASSTMDDAVDSRESSNAADSAAGAAGPGTDRTGASADDSGVPGMRAYMMRAEQSVIRMFRYPSRGSGRIAIFHFFVDRRGRISSLELRQTSGLPGLDKAGESAIRRATFPPIPPTLGFERVGVTFSFKDE